MSSRISFLSYMVIGVIKSGFFTGSLLVGPTICKQSNLEFIAQADGSFGSSPMITDFSPGITQCSISSSLADAGS